MREYPSTTMQEQETINLLEFFRVLMRRKMMIVTLVLASTSAAAIVSLLLPKYYKSEAVILAIAPESGGLSAALSASPLAGAFAGSLGGLSSPADKLLVLLKSRTVAEMVVRRFDLLKVFNRSKWDTAKNAWKDPASPPLMEDAVRQLSNNVVTFKKSKEGTISIDVEWKDPKLAAEIANYYVAALAEFMKDKSVNTTVQIVDPAVPAEKKSSPHVGKNAALAGILALFTGILVALILENLSKSSPR